MITVDRERTADFCRRHQVRKLALFGSALRVDFRPESDGDVLVEFEAGTCLGSRSSQWRRRRFMLRRKDDVRLRQWCGEGAMDG